MHQESVKDLAMAVLGRASEHASPLHQGDASPASTDRCPACAELIHRGAQDSLCSRCPAWPIRRYSAEEIRKFRRELEEPAEGPVYIRADGARQCSSCRDFEARGISVLHCGTCDLLTSCAACIRLGATCAQCYRGPRP